MTEDAHDEVEITLSIDDEFIRMTLTYPDKSAYIDLPADSAQALGESLLDGAHVLNNRKKEH